MDIDERLAQLKIEGMKLSKSYASAKKAYDSWNRKYPKGENPTITKLKRNLDDITSKLEAIKAQRT